MLKCHILASSNIIGIFFSINIKKSNVRMFFLPFLLVGGCCLLPFVLVVGSCCPFFRFGGYPVGVLPFQIGGWVLLPFYSGGRVLLPF